MTGQELLNAMIAEYYEWSCSSRRFDEPERDRGRWSTLEHAVMLMRGCTDDEACEWLAERLDDIRAAVA
jgi:hypothetical protein